MGHSFSVPASSLPAYLDQAQMEAAARIMRRNPDAESVADGEMPSEGGGDGDGGEEMPAESGGEPAADPQLAADMNRLMELYQEQAAEQDEFTAAKDSLRRNVIEAVSAVPGLKASAQSLAGGVEAYVDTWLKPLEGFAQRLSVTGQSPTETFRKLTLEAAKRSSGGQADFSSMTPEEAQAAYEQIMAEGIKAEIAGEGIAAKVRGRLDGKSLRDYDSQGSNDLAPCTARSCSRAKAMAGCPWTSWPTRRYGPACCRKAAEPMSCWRR
jgi:hypothetical protein